MRSDWLRPQRMIVTGTADGITVVTIARLSHYR
jgi:hypothetical protein